MPGSVTATRPASSCLPTFAGPVITPIARARGPTTSAPARAARTPASERCPARGACSRRPPGADAPGTARLQALIAMREQVRLDLPDCLQRHADHDHQAGAAKLEGYAQ